MFQVGEQDEIVIITLWRNIFPPLFVVEENDPNFLEQMLITYLVDKNIKADSSEKTELEPKDIKLYNAHTVEIIE